MLYAAQGLGLWKLTLYPDFNHIMLVGITVKKRKFWCCRFVVVLEVYVWMLIIS